MITVMQVACCEKKRKVLLSVLRNYPSIFKEGLIEIEKLKSAC
jgi:hypothetical protein